MKFRLHDFKRNFLVLVIACLLNFAFAFEKLFLVLGCPLSDLVWLIVYGGTALVLTFIAFYDYKCDVHESISTMPNII